jgi:hypothetical protein
MINEKLIFRSFRAINDIDTCLAYREGHVNILKDYGITNITTNNTEWFENPNIYGIVAELPESKKVVGGIRMQISDEDNKLPVEKAIGNMDSNIFNIVKRFRENGGVGELCGLWNSKEVAGFGISVLLTRAGISTTNQFECETLMGICAEYTLDMFRRVGFVVDDSLGLNGEFPYPNNSYIARVLGIMNSSTLNTAHEYDKQRMQSLRNDPYQTFREVGKKSDILIQYNLIYPLQINK